MNTYITSFFIKKLHIPKIDFGCVTFFSNAFIRRGNEDISLEIIIYVLLTSLMFVLKGQLVFFPEICSQVPQHE